jgi:MinD-like ATPase involved in chromosome partitioning or flagellar assembly/DNA-binding NarL/FixJ family response regulator
MQYGPSGGAVRVVIASDAPQAVAELDKLAGYADQVCLVGFIRRADELDEDLEALQPDLILLYTGFGGLDTVILAADLASRSALLRVMVVVDPADEPFITRLEDVGAATVPSDASPVALVTAIRGAAATSPPPPALSAPPAASWSGDATLSSPSAAVTEPPPEVPAGEAPAWTVRSQPAAASGANRWTEPAPDVAPADAPGGPEQSPAVITTGITAWPERLPGAGLTGTATRTEPGPAEVAFPSSVPVFQLDTAAFEPPPTGGPASGPEWPGVPMATATAPPAAEPEQDPIQPVRPRPVRRRTRGHAELAVVFSGKGGVGKSLIATNLAVALAAEGEKAAIVDLDLQFGDVAVMLHAESHPTGIDALAQQGEQVDPEFIDEVMATGPEGVRALLAPASPEFADLVNTANLRAILRELAKEYDFIVVDTPSHLEERSLEAIEMADQIIVVTSFNFAAIKDTKVTLKLLQSLGVDRDKISVVLNQTRAKVSFQRSEVEESLRFRVLTVLPFEPRLDDFIDEGQQIVTVEPKAEFSKQFRLLVDHIRGEEDDTPGKDPERARPGAHRRRFSLGRG